MLLLPAYPHLDFFHVRQRRQSRSRSRGGGEGVVIWERKRWWGRENGSGEVKAEVDEEAASGGRAFGGAERQVLALVQRRQMGRHGEVEAEAGVLQHVHEAAAAAAAAAAAVKVMVNKGVAS